MMRKDLKKLIHKLTVFLMLTVFSVPQIFAKNYGIYSHDIPQHIQNCASCHKVPSGNWATARGYPDVADYPGHASCLNCHRTQFFAGPKPAICVICHTNPSPRDAGRFAFPMPKRKGEFETIFPHDVHQDIIASNLPPEIMPLHLVNVSFSFDDDKKPAQPQFNNCSICHSTAAKLPPTGTRKPMAGLSLVADAHSETFTPEAAFFKTAPDSHASCFNCHYQNQKPARTDCAACHRLTAPHFDETKILRYSLKFNHEEKNHDNKDCATCHIRITQNADLRTMTGADVPILTCSTSACHGKILKMEIASREQSIKEKQPVFQCAYCHTAAIGSYEVPESHK